MTRTALSTTKRASCTCRDQLGRLVAIQLNNTKPQFCRDGENRRGIKIHEEPDGRDERRQP